MDPLKLLSRSTKLSKYTQSDQSTITPSGGQHIPPQLFQPGATPQNTNSLGKRKRTQDGNNSTLLETEIDADSSHTGRLIANVSTNPPHPNHSSDPALQGNRNVEYASEAYKDDELTSTDHNKQFLYQHKVKVTCLNQNSTSRGKPGKKMNGVQKAGSRDRPPLFPKPLQSFEHLATRYSVSRKLVANMTNQDFVTPTEVQLAALPLLLDDSTSYMSDAQVATVASSNTAIDLLTIAPTGSGKTFAYMIPLLHTTLLRKAAQPSVGRCISSIVLVPTKELAGQIVNEARKLAKGTGIRISEMRKGMALDPAIENANDDEFAKNTAAVVKADVIVATPGTMQRALHETRSGTVLSRVESLVLDEADVLLDPLFRQQTLEIWQACQNSHLRISLWSATMGSNIEQLALSTIEERRHQLTSKNVEPVPEAPLVRLVVGLKDSAVPNVQHKLIYAATEQGKLMGLRQLLHPTTTTSESGLHLRPPFLVFTQTIERATALQAELLYDIPAEAGGVDRIAVLHSDLSDTVRDSTMARFRKGDIWIIITTDLLSRGVDIRGVNGVVNYDIPTSSAAYVHRIGRTGRAGRQGGVAVTLYAQEDIPYIKHIANIVAISKNAEGDEHTMQKWLQESIPTLSKNEKQNLKKRGIESRSSRAQPNNPKAANKARISTKAGSVRKAENKRKGAIVGSRRRAEQEQDADEGDETDFGGFD